ncbi:cora-like Mg2+ transporter protein-domain-containing protein [Auriculariales sp. MPI-PUGE-AT-0066]|nr:cora-like Mg2+ transporter protein-domain-containing protein [Auriculariales sp. MPI-PUGE-AT-0066]
MADSSPRPIVLKLIESPTTDSFPSLRPQVGKAPSTRSGRSGAAGQPHAEVPSLRYGAHGTQLHRFGPSGPWPWTSFFSPHSLTSANDIPSRETIRGTRPSHPSNTALSQGHEWKHFPQSHFPNWTPAVIERSGLASEVFDAEHTSTNVLTIDLLSDGSLRVGRSFDGEQTDDFWAMLQQEPNPEVRLNCFFVEDLNGPILQMLGAWYDIEPFFFSSAINGIATRYEEVVGPEEEEHITITLPFLRAIDSATYNKSSDSKDDEELEEVIDLQTPLQLVVPDGPDQTLLLDMLAIHLIRGADESTIVMIHPESKYWLTTSAEQMKERVLLAAKGVYWENILKQSQDPTFMLLIFLWHALYAWDEAMEVLYEHILYLERRVMIKFNASDIWLTRELHIIRAMLLHYGSLLNDFHKTVRFIFSHPNRVHIGKIENKEEQQRHRNMLQRECDNILNEIERITDNKELQLQRVKNVMELVFSTLNVTETETTINQGWVMQQLSYVTMAFLPATFVSSIFGMNLNEFVGGTDLKWFHFVAVTVPLSIGTVWLMTAFQRRMHDPNHSFLLHLLWPFFNFLNLLELWRRRGFWRTKQTVIVDPTSKQKYVLGDEGEQEDGKETSQARVTRHWGWRPERGDSGSSTPTLSHSLRTSRRGTSLSESSVRAHLRDNRYPTAPAPAAVEQAIEAMQRRVDSKPWSKAKLGQIWRRPQRKDTIHELQQQ